MLNTKTPGCVGEPQDTLNLSRICSVHNGNKYETLFNRTMLCDNLCGVRDSNNTRYPANSGANAQDRIKGTSVVYPAGHAMAGQPMRLFQLTWSGRLVYNPACFLSHFCNETLVAKRAMDICLFGGSQIGLSVIPVYLNLKRLFRMHDLRDAWDSQHWWLEELSLAQKEPIYKLNREYDEIYGSLSDKNNGKTLIRMLRMRGYDGIVYASEYSAITENNGLCGREELAAGPPGDCYIPFSPNQIVPAIIKL